MRGQNPEDYHPAMLLPVLTAFLAAAIPKVGDVAPDFTVTDTEGQARHLAEMVKSGTVIVAFFPKAFSGGCTKELTAYRDRYADITHRSAQVLAVSTDDAATLAKFKKALKAPFSFVADPDATMTRLYDVKTPVLKFSQRYTFVVGADRKVLKVESGGDAINPEGAVVACPLHKPVAASTTVPATK